MLQYLKSLLIFATKLQTMGAAEYLSEFGLSRTTIRTKLMEVFYHADEALSSKEIEGKLDDDVDRVTLYRTIKLFEEKKIIHKIVIDNQVTKYKLINIQKGKEHPHFHCTACDKVLCLPDTPLPSCNLPEGFSIEAQNTIVEGTCHNCNQ